MKKLNTEGFSIVEVLVVLVVLCVIASAGWYVWVRQSTVNDANQPLPEQTKSTESESNANAEKWDTYTSIYQEASFSYPSSWQLSQEDDPELAEAKRVTLTSPQGFELYYSDRVDGLGGGCSDDTPTVSITAREELKNSKGVYLLENPSTLALTSEDLQVGDTGRCLVYAIIESKKGSNMMFGTNVQFLPNSQNFIDSQMADMETAREILKSFSY